MRARDGSCGEGESSRVVRATARVGRRCDALERLARALERRRWALGEDADADAVAGAVRWAEVERAAARGRAARAADVAAALVEERDSVRRALREANAMEAERLVPIALAAREECEMLREEIGASARRAETLATTRDERYRRARAAEDACVVAREDLLRLHDEAHESRGAPERARAEKDVLFEALTRAKSACAATETREDTARRAEMDAEDSVKRHEREISEACAKNASLDERLSTAHRQLNDLEALAESESLARDELAAEGVRHELERRSHEKALERLNQIILRAKRANAQISSRLREVLAGEKSARRVIEDAELAKSSLEGELASTLSDMERIKREQNELKLEVNDRREKCKAEITKADSLANTVSVTLREEMADLEQEVACLRCEEAARNRVRKHVADRVARAMRRLHGVKQQKNRLESLLRVRDSEIADMRASVDDARERRSHFQQLQELTRAQRDAFANVVRKSAGLENATREKMKRLDDEKIDLERRVRERDQEVRDARSRTEAMKRERDEQRGQNEAVSRVICRTREDADVGKTEVQKLKGEIESAKLDQELVFEQLRVLVKSRQAVAEELLDRNAELCRLCDRVATSEDVTRQCEEELSSRVHECEVLRRNVHDVERSVAVARRAVAAIPKYREDVSRKRAMLCDMQISAEELSRRLEDPNEHSRWRLIRGPKGAEEDDVHLDDVNEKLASLGERLDDAERELAKRRLRCQDIDRETERVRNVITSNADDALETSSSLNRARSKLSSIKRALLALVSEVTMYRALTDSLANAKSRNIAEVDALRLSLEEMASARRAAA